MFYCCLHMYLTRPGLIIGKGSWHAHTCYSQHLPRYLDAVVCADVSVIVICPENLHLSSDLPFVSLPLDSKCCLQATSAIYWNVPNGVALVTQEAPLLNSVLVSGTISKVFWSSVHMFVETENISRFIYISSFLFHSNNSLE